MTKNNLSNAAWKLRATGALVLALALSTFPAAFSRAVNAQTPAKTNAQAPAKATTSPATESKGGQKEGIKVHGHWTIEVRNPDGTLVTRREFENSLDNGLAPAEILGRANVIGNWTIMLGTFPCVLSGAPVACIVTEPTNIVTSATNLFKNLTVKVDSSLQAVVLSGTATASNAGYISSVRTIFGICGPDVSPNTCLTILALPRSFTSANVTPPVSVVAGQIIQVTVTISFS